MQLMYRWIDAGDRNRTYDPRITNALLYQLSYSGVEGAYVKQPDVTGNARSHN